MRVRGFLTIVLLGLLSLPVSQAAAQESFVDVDSDAYYAEAVDWMLLNGLTSGGGDGQFRPDDPVTRGEIAVFLWRLADKPDAPRHGFTDVMVGWQNDAISWMSDAGITAGATETTFAPDGLVSRGALSVFLHRLAGEPVAVPHAFGDVPAGVLDMPVSWVAEVGISTGVEPGKFGPDAAVTRGQAALFLQRFDGTGALATAVEESVVPEAPEPTIAETESEVLLAVSPSSPRVGERVVIAGSGLDAGQVLVTIGDEVAGATEVAPNGSFAFEILTPELPEGEAVVVLVQDGAIVGSESILVRAEAPSIGWLFPVLLLLAALGAVGYWWWNYGKPISEATESESLIEDRLPVPEPEPADLQPVVKVERTDRFAIYPLGSMTPGVVNTLTGYDGHVWGTVRSEFEGGDHALVVRSKDHGQSWDVISDLGPGYVDSVAVSGRDAVAFGSRFVAQEHGMVRKAAMWHSNDLKTWVAVNLTGELFEEASFDGVVTHDEVLVAYGRNVGGPCLWVGSDDGWKVRRMPGPVDSLVSTAKGVLVFGRDPERRTGVVLRSTDGIRWESSTHPSAVMFDSATILSVVDFQDGLVAAGFDNLRGLAAVWVSDDGVHWHRSPMEFGERTGIEQLEVVGAQLVAVGSSRAKAHASRTSDLTVWTSEDAITWHSAGDEGLGKSSRMNSSVATGSAVLISGERLSESATSGAPVVWSFFASSVPAPA